MINRVLIAVCLSVALLLALPVYTTVSNLRITGGTPPTTIDAQGAWLSWNHTVSGETDFVNGKGFGAGGFNWYNVATSAGFGSPIMTMDGFGNLEANTVLANSLTAVGNITGNTVTASTFTGHLNNITFGHSGGCGTMSGAYAECSSAVNWNQAFSDTNYAASCMIINPFGSPAIAGAFKANGSLTVVIRNGINNGGVNSGGSLDCIASEN